MSFGGVLKDKDGKSPTLDGADPPRWTDAGWLDGPLVMGRMDVLARLRERRAAAPPQRVGVWDVRFTAGRVASVTASRGSGVSELDELVEALYRDAEAPFGGDRRARVRLHPPGSGPWPPHVRGPEVQDRKVMACELGPVWPSVELEVKLEGACVRQVRVLTPGLDPDHADRCAALFRSAELPRYHAAAEWVAAQVG